MTRFFTVQFDEDGRVCSTSMDYIASIDKSDAIEYARTVLASGTSRGYTGDYRYQSACEGGKTTVCFLNTIREQQFMKELRTLTAEVALGSLVLVFLLVYLFSSTAIRPFESNIERQKQFITDASHELKTPLTSISTSIDVISLEHGEDEWTENIRKQTGRMTKLVGELVTLTRMNEGIPLPNRDVFSLSEAAWEIAEVYRPQAKAHGKELQLQIQEPLSCFGEKNSVQQMLSVLLDNAVRYSDENSTIGVRIMERRGRVHIEVRNACAYETVPDVRQLFDRFYRPDSSRSTHSGGEWNRSGDCKSCGGSPRRQYFRQVPGGENHDDHCDTVEWEDSRREPEGDASHTAGQSAPSAQHPCRSAEQSLRDCAPCPTPAEPAQSACAGRRRGCSGRCGESQSG